MWMLDGVKLTPTGKGQHDQAKRSGNGQAKTDIDESQQSSFCDHQSLK
jgi:hypothetical protein